MNHVVVRYTRPSALHIPLGKQSVVLAPGDNQLVPEQWIEMKKLRSVRRRLDKGLLIEVPRVDPDAPGLIAPPTPKGLVPLSDEDQLTAGPDGDDEEATATTPLSVNFVEARNQILACEDLEMLRHWGSSEQRPILTTVLYDRYKELGGKA